MRRITWMLAIVISVSLLVAGCGKKDTGTIVKDLEQVVSKMDSYQAIGTMNLHTGQQPQEYYVEVWYQNPHYYRIALTNQNKDITQIVLRNDDGVFVLTPHLNKSFRFQSNWPENQGQVYLYQTLIQSIVMDNSRQFLDEKDGYVFDVAANYNNGSLARQKVWLDKKTYAPQHVEVMDNSGKALVVVEFSHFEFNKKFDAAKDFDMQHNMTSATLQSLPTMLDSLHPDVEAGSMQELQKNFGVIEPVYMPAGVRFHDVSEVKVGDELGVLLRYTGTYNYTLMESRPDTRTVTLMGSTRLADLGYTMGVLTGDTQKSLIWHDNGVEFTLTSRDLPEEEMILIAQSVHGQIGK